MNLFDIAFQATGEPVYNIATVTFHETKKMPRWNLENYVLQLVKSWEIQKEITFSWGEIQVSFSTQAAILWTLTLVLSKIDGCGDISKPRTPVLVSAKLITSDWESEENEDFFVPKARKVLLN